MRLSLQLHPKSACDAIRAFEVDVEFAAADRLLLAYDIEGEIGDLLLPPARAGTRADELWRRTCFEAFLKPQGADAYLELNLAPSGDFAAYHFERYRAGMTAAVDVAPDTVASDSRLPRRKSIALGKRDGWYQQRVTWRIPQLAPQRIGLSAVIEEVGGRRSYWALEHPPGAPDFHHLACFAAELPPPEQP